MDARTAPLSELKALRAQVDGALDGLVPDAGEAPHRIHAAMRYAVLGPGKRLRPILALLSASHLGGQISTVLPVACAVEFIHAASLVLDDLPCMDDAALRRGQPSVHARYGEEVAVLTGVALLNEAYAIIGRAEGLDDGARVAMLGLLARTVGPSGLVGGQDKDLIGMNGLSAAAASQLHHEKTGVLFVASVEIGALAAGACEDARAALRMFALELGLAFQAIDDLEDEDDLEKRGSVSNLQTIMGVEGLRGEAERRLTQAKAALTSGPPELAPMGRYVDLLMGRVAA
jgi:geranylgeranyl diphosphate synthase type II